MKIKFLGAVGEVTGSCTWCILDNGTQFLVDCGIFQGPGADDANRRPFPFNPWDLSFVLLTHAHADHCGRIPLLYKHGFQGEVICTQAAKDLTLLNLTDAAKRGAFEQDSLYDPSDVKKIRFSDKVDEHQGFGSKGATFSIGRDIWVSFARSSHMLGAASITVSWEQDQGRKRIFFSGDIGNNREGCCYQPLLKRNYLPLEGTDYIVSESTYGAKPAKEARHQDPCERMEAIKEIVLSPKHDLVMFPCFAMQRTQDVLFDLVCALQYCGADASMSYRIILDSAMARAACDIFKLHLTKMDNGDNIYLNDKCVAAISERYGHAIDAHDLVGKIFHSAKGEQYQFGNLSISFGINLNWMKYAPNLAENEKVILITSSGMCHEGKILYHLENLRSERVALVLTGYQSTTNGRVLQKLAEESSDIAEDEVLETSVSVKKSDGQEKSWTVREKRELPIKDIKGDVFNLGAYYSGHADRDNLLRFLFEPAGQERKGAPQKAIIFLNHGDNAARREFKKAIEERAHQEADLRTLGEVIIPPAGGEFYDLNKGAWDSVQDEVVQNQKQIMSKLDRLLEISSTSLKKGKKK